VILVNNNNVRCYSKRIAPNIKTYTGGVDMELTIGVNSYMDLTEAEELVKNELLATEEEYITWNSLSDDDKTKLIVRGTRLVDQLPFLGYKLDNSQTLHWPRLLTAIKFECPTDIKVGLIRQVIRDYSNRNKQENKLQELGVKTYSINKASISFGDKNTSKLENGVYNDIFQEYFRRWVY
jgi:hypothetical protein